MGGMSTAFWILSGVSFLFIIVVLVYLLTRKIK